MSESATLTTGDACRIMQVSQQTVIKEYNKGSIKGFKIPGSKHRRIFAEPFKRYLIENGMWDHCKDRYEKVLKSKEK